MSCFEHSHQPNLRVCLAVGSNWFWYEMHMRMFGQIAAGTQICGRLHLCDIAAVSVQKGAGDIGGSPSTHLSDPTKTRCSVRSSKASIWQRYVHSIADGTRYTRPGHLQVGVQCCVSACVCEGARFVWCCFHIRDHHLAFQQFRFATMI